MILSAALLRQSPALKNYVFGAKAIIPWLVRAGYPIPSFDFDSLRDVDMIVADHFLDVGKMVTIGSMFIEYILHAI